MKINRLIPALGILIAVFGVLSNRVSAEGVKEIYTPDDLMMIAEAPSEDYILMSDIDMNGYNWKPVDFSGNFDGNNHAILNLNITETSDSTRVTYDGNYKTYDTYFAGFFGALENGSVKNLKLLGINVNIDTNTDCFVAPIAGFAEGSNIENCSIEGFARLDVSAKMFGVGGIVGYGGNGAILDTSTDVTLVCIDHDSENRDEQFMGGAYGAGYLDVNNCHINIEGYDSDHGYVHNGGLVGMYILYPRGLEYAGYINNTRVEGIITFFEDNRDRRAYCKDFMGEVMNWTYEYVGNSSDFKPNEIFDYSTDLLPHFCTGNDFAEEEIAADDTNYGYTLYTCNECGNYSYKGKYTVKAHNVSSYTEKVPATYEETGLEEGVCDSCGEAVYRVTPVLEKPAEPEPEPEPITIVPELTLEEDTDKNVETEDRFYAIVFIVSGVIAVGLTGAIVYVFASKPKKNKKRH